MSTAAKPSFKEKYENFIGGKFVPPVKGEYFDKSFKMICDSFKVSKKFEISSLKLLLSFSNL